MKIKHGFDIVGGYHDVLRRFHPTTRDWPFRVITGAALEIKVPDWHSVVPTDEEVEAAFRAAHANGLTGAYTLEVSGGGRTLLVWDRDPWRPSVVLRLPRTTT